MIHAADAGVFHDEFFGDKVPFAEGDDEVATLSQPAQAGISG